MKWTARLTALAFVASSLAGPYVGQDIAVQTLGPAGVLIVIWLLLTARHLARSRPMTARDRVAESPAIIRN